MPSLQQDLDADGRHKLLAFRRGALVLVFNFHPTESQADYRLGVPEPADYELVLDTDDPAFGGFGLVTAGQVYPWQDQSSHGLEQSIQVYIPARSAQVLTRK